MLSKKKLIEIYIREIQFKDIPEINRIYNESIQMRTATAHLEALPVNYHEEWYYNHIRSGNPILVAESGDTLVGWNSLSDYRSGRQALQAVRETSYYVDQTYWGSGVASELMVRMIELAKGLEVKTLVTFIMDANPVSVKLMDKFGFELWGRLPQIIEMGTKKFDHLIFGKKL